MLGPSLFETCAKINLKSSRISIVPEIGAMQEISVAQRMRLNGRTFRTNPVLIEYRQNRMKTEISFCSKLFDLLCADDPGGELAKQVLVKFRSHCDSSMLKLLEPALDKVGEKLGVPKPKVCNVLFSVLRFKHSIRKPLLLLLRLLEMGLPKPASAIR